MISLTYENKGDSKMVIEEEIQYDMEKALRNAEMEIAKRNFIYDIVNNKQVEKSRHSEEVEKCVEVLIKRLQGDSGNIDILKKVMKENISLKEKLAKLEKDTLKISSSEDIEIVKVV